MTGHWTAAADRVLGELFKLGQPAPTREEIRDAYPFGQRAYWPYKVWCKRVKAWISAHKKGMAAQPPVYEPRMARKARQERRDRATLDMFAGGER